MHSTPVHSPRLAFCMHAFIPLSLSLSTATLECHQLHTWLAQCLFKLIALYDIMCCKWNRKMCYGSWNYGTFQFSFSFLLLLCFHFLFPLLANIFFLLKKSHIITHQKQRHILYFILRYMHRWCSGKKSENWKMNFFPHHNTMWKWQLGSRNHNPVNVKNILVFSWTFALFRLFHFSSLSLLNHSTTTANNFNDQYT